MTYTLFVDDLATYVSTSLEHAKELAEPYVGLGRSVAIRYYDTELPPTAWRYDFGKYEWIVGEATAEGRSDPTQRRRFARLLKS